MPCEKPPSPSVFFFSSRRRHTRSKRDWSSDVCSSDLAARARSTCPGKRSNSSSGHEPRRRWTPPRQIGRASCRERAESSVVAGGVTKKEPCGACMELEESVEGVLRVSATRGGRQL